MVASLRAALFSLACLLAFAIGTAPSSAADTDPSHPVHFINGFAAGGPVDTVARIMAQRLSDRLGGNALTVQR